MAAIKVSRREIAVGTPCRSNLASVKFARQISSRDSPGNVPEDRATDLEIGKNLPRSSRLRWYNIDSLASGTSRLAKVLTRGVYEFYKSLEFSQDILDPFCHVKTSHVGWRLDRITVLHRLYRKRFLGSK